MARIEQGLGLPLLFRFANPLAKRDTVLGKGSSEAWFVRELGFADRALKENRQVVLQVKPR